MSAVVWRPGTGIVCGAGSTGVRGTVVRSAVPAAAGGAGLTGGGAGGKGGGATPTGAGRVTERCASRPIHFWSQLRVTAAVPADGATLNMAVQRRSSAEGAPASKPIVSPISRSSFIHRICPGNDRNQAVSVSSCYMLIRLRHSVIRTHKALIGTRVR
jgi:hypothetical protein